jgi:hypothetical protein
MTMEMKYSMKEAEMQDETEDEGSQKGEVFLSLQKLHSCIYTLYN